MKKVLIYFVAGVFVILLLVFVISLFLKSDYYVERSKTVTCSKEEVMNMVGDFRNWPKWSPWEQSMPDMKITYGEVTDEVGGWYSWEHKDGNGRMDITDKWGNDSIAYKLTFEGMEPASIKFILNEGSEGVDVKWNMSGDFGSNPIAKIFGLFFDGMIGPEYEKGLSNISENCKK